MAENWWGVQAKAWLHRPSFPTPPRPFFGVIVCSFTEISISVEVKVKDSMFDLITSAGHSYFIGGANVLGHKMMVVVLFRSGGTVSPALLDFQSFLLCGLFKEFVSCFSFSPLPPSFFGWDCISLYVASSDNLYCLCYSISKTVAIFFAWKK